MLFQSVICFRDAMNVANTLNQGVSCVCIIAIGMR